MLLEKMVKAMGVGGLAFLAWPFVKAWLPDLSRKVTRDVALGDLRPGEVRIVRWLGRNVMIRRRDSDTLRRLADARDVKDPRSVDSTQPPFAGNPWRSLVPEYFVAYTNCTHLGCEVAAVDRVEDNVGFKCPCHQSEYDYAGRVKEGAVAPFNLEVPWYRQISGNLIRLEKEKV